jgi:murein DD-endopeptidase MepM/ murein hydrolase activator NlpD
MQERYPRMRKVRRAILALVVAGLTLSRTGGGALAAKVPAPAGMGRYCSVTWPDGAWALAWYSNLTQNPCDYLARNTAPGARVQRAGLYSTTGMNNVVVRCDNNSWVWLGTGAGGGPLGYTFNQAKWGGHTGCIFTASPREMPVLRSPFPAYTWPHHVTGVDFARWPYGSLNLASDFGQPRASTAATKVNWKGRDRSSTNYVDDHDGHDWNVWSGTKLHAVANGRVLAARFRDVSNACPEDSSKIQGEVYIEHVVSGGSGSSAFDEQFVSFYAHLSSIKVKPGDIVAKGQVIGYSGDTGCSSAPHLHFGVYRVRNTAAYRYWPIRINTNFSTGHDQNSSNLHLVMIEPYGFYPPSGFDPWAWRAYPYGALSVNLWERGQAPPGNW